VLAGLRLFMFRRSLTPAGCDTVPTSSRTQDRHAQALCPLQQVSTKPRRQNLVELYDQIQRLSGSSEARLRKAKGRKLRC
jgi:hypothetical protein